MGTSGQIHELRAGQLRGCPGLSLMEEGKTVVGREAHPQVKPSWEVYAVSIPAGIFPDIENVTWRQRSRAMCWQILDKSRFAMLIAMASWGGYCVINMLLMVAISIPFWKFYFEGLSGLIFRVLMFIPLVGLFLSAFRYMLPPKRRIYFSHVWDFVIIVLALAISWLNPLAN